MLGTKVSSTPQTTHTASRSCHGGRTLLVVCTAAHRRSMPNVGPGVVLAVPVADTLKLVNKVDARAEIPITCVGETLDRSQLWHAMTPQVFRLGALRSALTVASDRGFAVTDDSQAMESVGVFPWLVRGRRSNIKLTYSEDSELIEAILLARRTAVV